MADINKTIKDIEECLSASCRGYKPNVYCPRSDEEWDIMRDALELLKEQEARIRELEEELKALKYGDQDTLKSAMMPAT